MTTATATAAAISLDQLQVASPCPAKWDDMTGDDRTRHCAECQMNVYNLAGMTRDEATTLVQEAEGRVCVRFFRRPDGTVITRDCPVGLRAVRRAVIRGVSRVAAMVILGLGGLVYGRAVTDDTARINGAHNLPTNSTLGRWLHVTDPELLMGEAVMGDIACPAPVMGRIAAPTVVNQASPPTNASR